MLCYVTYAEPPRIGHYREYPPPPSQNNFCPRDLGHVTFSSLRDSLMITYHFISSFRKRQTQKPFSSFYSNKGIVLPAITECGFS